MKWYSRVLALSILLVTFQIIYAQSDNCPQLVQQALVMVQNSCADLGRNQACYGNNRLESILTDAALQFNQPADRVPVESVQKLRTFPLNEQLGEWGVALLHIQANLPDTLPGQAVKFILYGDVELLNAAGSGTDVKPMQAFYFTSGGQEPACKEALPSSLVIQSPGGQKVNLTINGLDLNIGSSVALKATAGKRMSITTLEGLVETEYEGETRVIPGGFESSVPLGGEEGLTVNGPLEEVYLFDDEAWVTLADATDGLVETEIALPDTDLWNSAEAYCADPANAEVCDKVDFLDSLSFTTCQDVDCIGVDAESGEDTRAVEGSDDGGNTGAGSDDNGGGE